MGIPAAKVQRRNPRPVRRLQQLPRRGCHGNESVPSAALIRAVFRGVDDGVAKTPIPQAGCDRRTDDWIGTIEAEDLLINRLVRFSEAVRSPVGDLLLTAKQQRDRWTD